MLIKNLISIFTIQFSVYACNFFFILLNDFNLLFINIYNFLQKNMKLVDPFLLPKELFLEIDVSNY